MDILAALEASPDSKTAGGRCKLQRTLDEIPDDAAGKPQLLAAVEAIDSNTNRHAFAAKRLSAVFGHLGRPVGDTVIKYHRGRVCACYVGQPS